MSSMIDDDLHGYHTDEDIPHDDLLDAPDHNDVYLKAVQSLVNALGGYEDIETSPGKIENVYRPGDSVLAVLKDLKKLWRKDDSDDERTVARCMAKAGLMKELLAIIVELTDRGDWGRKVSLVACDLVAALTWPIDVAQELKETADEPDLVTDYASLLRAQVEYKAMILQNGAPLRCLLALMLPSLARPRKDERDEQVISLGLHIIRNLLAIKDAVAEGTATGEKEELANLQSSLILQLDRLTYFQLLLTLASCADKSEFNQYNVLVLDILHLIFRSVKARDLGQDQTRAPVENLTKLLEAETRKKAQKSRGGNTRHSRFGTTVYVKAGDQRIVLHKQNAISANAGKILDEVKRKRAGRVKRVDDLTYIVNLSPDALRVLQNFAQTFVQSSFNTFFATILKDIRMERSKVRDTDNTRTFYLTRFFIEYLLILRQKQELRKESSAKDKQKAVDVQHDEDEWPLGLVAEMAEMESVRWVFMRMKITMDDKPPAWTELQACLDCFTQILLLIDAMSSSGIEEDVEGAEILQNQLYYNGDILDSSLTVVAQYKDQSVAYLDSVIHYAYVLLRMLEKYSKTKAFMFIRKRRAARHKRKLTQDQLGVDLENSAIPPDEDEEGEGDGGADRDAPSYREHAFTFQSFEKRFANEAVVHTLLTYMARWQEFDDGEQMKRVVGLMHRQVVKTQAEGLYFKVTCLDLFRRILDEQQSLPKTETTKSLLQLINYILRKFFKKVNEDPFVIVQALGPKSRGHWKELSSYKSDESDDDGMGGQRARIKEKMGMMELEFKKNKGLSWSQQMGVVVGVLSQAGHEDWVNWIIEVLELALAARQEIVLSVDGSAETRGLGENDDDDEAEERARDFSGPSREAIDKFQQQDLEADGEARKGAAAKDPHLRLMLKLLSFQWENSEIVEAQKWYLPSTILPSSLETSLGALRQFLATPTTPDLDPKTLLRKARPPRRQHDSLDPESEDEDRPKKIRKKKVAETQVYKSAAFILDSDYDEAGDAAFFEKERELRREMQNEAERVGQGAGVGGKRKRVKKGGKGKGNGRKSKDAEIMEDSEEGGDEGISGPNEKRARSSDVEMPQVTDVDSGPEDAVRANGNGHRSAEEGGVGGSDEEPAASRPNGRSRKSLIVHSDTDSD